MTRHVLRERRHRLRILLAEDNVVNQRLAVRLVERQGHAVVVAGTGRAALEALERERFDLVLMDLQMPDMDGLAALTAIRELEARASAGDWQPAAGSSFAAAAARGAAGGRIPVIAVTAHAMQGDEERWLAAGMDGYVTKPIQPAALASAIERSPRARSCPVRCRSRPDPTASAARRPRSRRPVDSTGAWPPETRSSGPRWRACSSRAAAASTRPSCATPFGQRTPRGSGGSPTRSRARRGPSERRRRRRSPAELEALSRGGYDDRLGDPRPASSSESSAAPWIPGRPTLGRVGLTPHGRERSGRFVGRSRGLPECHRERVGCAAAHGHAAAPRRSPSSSARPPRDRSRSRCCISTAGGPVTDGAATLSATDTV